MTMASGPSPPTLDDMQMKNFKSIYDFLKPWFEPSTSKAKPKQDLSATINGPQGSGFMQSMRMLNEMMSPKPDSSLDSAKAGSKSSTEQGKPQGAQKNEGSRGEESGTAAGGSAGSTGSRSLTRGDRENKQTDGNKDLSKTMKKDDERSPIAHKTILDITVSSASTASKPDSPKPVEEVETVSHGSAPITHQDAMDLKRKADDRLEQIKLLEKDIGLLTQEKDDLKKRNAQIDQLQNEKRDLKSQINQMEENNNVLTMRHTEACANLKEACANLKKKNEDCEALIETRNEHLKLLLHYENTLKKNEESLEERDRTIRTLGTDLEKLNKEYNDVKSRFSKLAGDKLTDQNPDIADLSDPNRAMKLSEKFGALYDDAWTDAFEYLTDKKKQKPKDAIQYLLECLKECWGLCQKEAATWMNSLQQVFLYPVQDTEAISKMQGGKAAVRLGSKDLRVIRDACRKIAPTVGIFVKQCFIMQMKKKQKFTDECLTYLEGCVDVCWLMVLAEPPLHIEFNIKPGDKFDTNRHVAYQASGEKVEFLVWPPLYNALEGGGMLSKGTVSTERKIEKPSKK